MKMHPNATRPVIWLAVLAVYSIAATLFLVTRDHGLSAATATPSSGGATRLASLAVQTLEGEPFDLAELWRDKPLLICCTSLSCPLSRSTYPRFQRLARAYEGKLGFALLYTLEAHPIGSASPYPEPEWILEENARADIRCAQHATLAERQALARDYIARHGVTEPVYLDDMDNAAWERLGQRPNCAVLIREDGRIIERHEWFDDLGMERILRSELGLEPAQ